MTRSPHREEYYRRHRAKNRAMLVVLLAVVAMFFVITVVKMRQGEMDRHGTTPSPHGATKELDGADLTSGTEPARR